MDWKELGQAIARIGLPLLGAALPVPGGAAMCAALAGMLGAKSAEPQDILTAITGNAEALAKAKEFEAAHQEKLLQMAYDYEVEMRKADSADVASVNATMQEELKNSAIEAWYQKGWRPFNGFVFGITLFMNYGLPSIVNTFAPMFAVPWIPVIAQVIPEFVFVAWGAVLGVTAWHRGRMQVTRVGKE